MLIVETGAGAYDSETYASTDTAAAYADANGLTFVITGDDLTLAEQALRRGTKWLDAYFRDRFPGWKTNGRNQALEWPRTGAYDNATLPQTIGQNEIPIEIINACIEAAIREKATPGYLSPDVTMSEVYSQIQAGSVSLTRANTSSVSDQIPLATKIEQVLSGLLCPQPGAGAPILRV